MMTMRMMLITMTRKWLKKIKRAQIKVSYFHYSWFLLKWSGSLVDFTLFHVRTGHLLVALKQFGPISCMTKLQAWSGSKLYDLQLVWYPERIFWKTKKNAKLHSMEAWFSRLWEQSDLDPYCITWKFTISVHWICFINHIVFQHVQVA